MKLQQPEFIAIFLSISRKRRREGFARAKFKRVAIDVARDDEMRNPPPTKLRDNIWPTAPRVHKNQPKRAHAAGCCRRLCTAAEIEICHAFPCALYTYRELRAHGMRSGMISVARLPRHLRAYAVACGRNASARNPGSSPFRNRSQKLHPTVTGVAIDTDAELMMLTFTRTHKVIAVKLHIAAAIGGR